MEDDRQATAARLPFKQGQKRAVLPSSQAAHLFTDSSEPATFSSDDDPSLDNYVDGSRKRRRHVGSWYRHEPQNLSSDAAVEGSDGAVSRPPLAANSGPPRKLRRDLDSGVWLPSDDELPVAEEEPVLPVPRAARARVLSRATSVRNISPDELRAQAIIQTCIDEGKENVDLTGIGLQAIAGSTIRPLSELQVHPTVVQDVAFEPREPSLKLYMGRNVLRRIPAAVFDLTALTVLSLRGNRLQELPPCIGRLRNLVEINVAQNSLGWLPRELLGLFAAYGGKLQRVHLHPNPFWQATPTVEGRDKSDASFTTTSQSSVAHVHGTTPSSLRSRTGLTRNDFRARINVAANHRALTMAHAEGICGALCHRSPVQYFDGRGVNVSSFDLASVARDRAPLPTEPLFSEPAGPHALASRLFLDAPSLEVISNAATTAAAITTNNNNTTPRTLLELGLQACKRAPDSVNLRALMPDPSPDRLLHLIDEAVAQRESGGYQCARPACRGRQMVVPRTMWVEWYMLGHNIAMKNPPPQTGTGTGTGTDTGTGTHQPNDDAQPGQQQQQQLLFAVHADTPLVPFLSRGCSWRCLPTVPEKNLMLAQPGEVTSM